MKNKVTGIILTAGNSVRYGKSKNFEKINNKEILTYSILAFNDCEQVNDVLLVIRKEDENRVNDILKSINLNKKIGIVYGSNTRQGSVYNALNNTNSDIVVIHDGARPCIKKDYIIECIKEIKNYDGVTIGVKSKDTVKITDDNNNVISTTPRVNTWIIQTPQCFKKDILLEMHNKYKNNDSITDDCMLLEKDNYNVKIIKGDYSNIKLTTKEDLNILKEYLENKE